MLAERYQVASDNIIYDTIEGQVILLNLDTGTYYQIKDSAVSIWNKLVNGASASELAAPFLSQHPAQADAIEHGIAEFVRELQAEALIRPRGDNVPPLQEPLPLESAPEANGNFVAPTLLKYTDMQALLLLDPIHDVEAHGWPIANPNQQP